MRTKPAAVPDRLVTRREGYRILALSNTTGFRRERDDPNFPQPIEIGPKRFGFRLSELMKYLDSLPRREADPERSRAAKKLVARGIAAKKRGRK